MSLAGRVCLFSTYFTGATLPGYVKRYLEELRRHFGRIVVITNDDKSLADAERAWLRERGLELMLVANEGFDFGMWHKALAQIDTAALEWLALVNDSCVLFAPLDDTLGWVERSAHEAAGIVDSNQVRYHLQSYFLVLRGRAIAAAVAYFQRHGVLAQGVDRVIETYEVGLSQHLLAQGIAIGARYSVRASGWHLNPSAVCIEPLVAAGMPLVKRKALTLGYDRGVFRAVICAGYDPDPERHVRLIRERHALSDADVATLFGDALAQQAPRRARLRWWKFRYGTLRRLLGRTVAPGAPPFSVGA